MSLREAARTHPPAAKALADYDTHADACPACKLVEAKAPDAERCMDGMNLVLRIRIEAAHARKTEQGASP